MPTAQLRRDVWLALACSAVVECSHAPLITPGPVAAGLLARQFDNPGPTCGYVDADILQGQYCQNGFTCFAEPSFHAAGGCCRLGDDANCRLATRCVPQTSLSSCDSACSSNARITRCTDSASPYCYTNYWPTAGQTLLNIGCTTAQGQFSFIYTTYTLYGQGFSDSASRTQGQSPIPTFTNADTSAVATGTGNEGVAAGTSGSGSVSNSGITTATTNDNSGGSSSNVGAIAGGVVGGVAVLGLIAALIVWIILRNRRKESAKGTTPGSGNGAVAGEHHHDSKPPVSPATSPMAPYVPARKPVANELQGGGDRHEVLGYSEAHELQHHEQRVPELP